jgi:di/tricarboxylate transporter
LLRKQIENLIKCIQARFNCIINKLLSEFYIPCWVCYKKKVVEHSTCPLFYFLFIGICILQAMWCAYCIIVMAIYWIFECVPLAITSLIPVVLLPLTGNFPAQSINHTDPNREAWWAANFPKAQ